MQNQAPLLRKKVFETGCCSCACSTAVPWSASAVSRRLALKCSSDHSVFLFCCRTSPVCSARVYNQRTNDVVPVPDAPFLPLSMLLLFLCCCRFRCHGRRSYTTFVFFRCVPSIARFCRRSIWYDQVSIPLSLSCATVSFIAAICTVYRFRSLDDYLTLRISTTTILRERTIGELTEGYDLRCFVVNRTLAHGSINGYTGGFPVEFHGGTEIGNLVQIEDRFFRVVSAIENTIGLTQRYAILPKAWWCTVCGQVASLNNVDMLSYS